jgi:hypothetical protein
VWGNRSETGNKTLAENVLLCICVLVRECTCYPFSICTEMLDGSENFVLSFKRGTGNCLLSSFLQ